MPQHLQWLITVDPADDLQGVDCFEEENVAELATLESIFKSVGFFSLRLSRPSMEFFLPWFGGDDDDDDDDMENDFLFSILDVHFIYLGLDGLHTVSRAAVPELLLLLLLLLLFLALLGSCESVVGMMEPGRCQPMASRD